MVLKANGRYGTAMLLKAYPAPIKYKVPNFRFKKTLTLKIRI